MKKNYGGIILLVIMLGLGLLRVVSHGSAAASPSSGTSANANLAPDFSLQTVAGRTISLADYHGKKPVVLDFFATWCPNCQRNTPHLSTLYEQYKDRIEVIGIDLHEDAGIVSNFIGENHIAFPVAVDTTGAIANDYNIQYTNTHFLIDKEGRLVRTIHGDISESDIQSLL